MMRRLVVSLIYSIYDPLELRSPINICYKLVLQKLSTNSPGWDDEIPVELAEECRAVLKEMVLVSDMVLPRSVNPEGTEGNLKFVAF